MSTTEKKQAIAWALTPYLSDDNLSHALQIWESKYSAQPTFALQRFLSEFCNTAALAGQRSQILQSLIKALSGADGAPLAQFRATTDIAATPTPARAPASPFDTPSYPEVHVFSHLMEVLFGLLEGDLGIKCRLYLLDNLPGLGLPQHVQRSLHAWLSQQYTIPRTIRIDEATLSRLIHLARTSLGEHLGSAKTDRLLQEALARTERDCRHLPYSAHKLL